MSLEYLVIADSREWYQGPLGSCQQDSEQIEEDPTAQDGTICISIRMIIVQIHLNSSNMFKSMDF